MTKRYRILIEWVGDDDMNQAYLMDHIKHYTGSDEYRDYDVVEYIEENFREGE